MIKCQEMKTSANLESAETLLSNESESESDSEPMEFSGPAIIRSEPSTSTTGSLLEQFLNTTFGEDTASDTTPNLMSEKHKRLLSELESYKEAKRMAVTTSVLEEWNKRSRNQNFLFLSELARAVLAVPTTQVSVERCFSSLKLILTDHRTQLSEENLENILLYRLNN